jgi:hypothetical protein
MFGAVDLNEIMKDDVLTREFFGDSSWRILPLDAKPADHDMFPGSTVAHGNIYNDSRGIFLDGDRVRTSTVKQVVDIDGETYIETRNTMYKLIDKPE